MRTKRNRILAGAGVAVVIGALAVGTAAAQMPVGNSGSMHQTVVGKAAAILGVPEAEMNTAFAQAHSQALDDAVKAGQLSQAQADWMKQRYAAMVSGSGPVGMMLHGMMGGRNPMMGDRFGGYGYGPPWSATPSPAR